MATELEKHGCNLNDKLWFAKILMENPGMIYKVHMDYFLAGADCTITASYQASMIKIQSYFFPLNSFSTINNSSLPM
jgi:S-methylmethionine-dependent homocysteine/selenocysteine methylase